MLEVLGEILELLFDIAATILHIKADKANRVKGGDTTEGHRQNTMASGVPTSD
jgi:hypothetical protein